MTQFEKIGENIVENKFIFRYDAKMVVLKLLLKLGLEPLEAMRSTDELVDAIFPAELPVSAVEYIHISNRMLKEDYRAWYKLMVFEGNDNADKAIAWMKEWAREHPEERDKK